MFNIYIDGDDYNFGKVRAVQIDLSQTPQIDRVRRSTELLGISYRIRQNSKSFTVLQIRYDTRKRVQSV